MKSQEVGGRTRDALRRVSLPAAAVAALVLGTATAWAVTTVTVSPSGSTLRVTGDDGANKITIEAAGAHTIKIKDQGGAEVDGSVTQCSQENGVTVICDTQDFNLVLVRVGAGNDKLGVLDLLKGLRLEAKGSSGKDELTGNDGKETFLGGGSADVLKGGDNNDKFRGDSGTDLFIGGKGRDCVDDATHAEREKAKGIESFGNDCL